MRKALVLILTTLLLTAFTGTAATARSEVVSLPFCSGGSGGVIKAPHNTPISLRLGWFTSPKGAVTDFLQSETLKVSVNGVPVQNADSYWGPVLQVDTNVWGVVWLYPTGISLNGGETITVTFSLYVSHTLTEVNPDTGERTFFGPGYVFGPSETCTIR